MQNLRRGLNSRGLNKQPKNRRLNKGFTLVELSIVIAVIAILIAVLVPTFTSIINKAKKTSDQSLVSNLNTTLSVDKAINGGYDNVTEAITVLLEDYSLSDLTATADDCAIAYDMDAQEMVLLENYQPVDSEAESSKICLLGLENASAAAESGITNFCVYDNESTSVTVETEETAEIYLYTENNTSETVVTIKAANATVKQYGEAEEIIIEEVDSQSFHVYGTVDTINLTEGHVELHSGSTTETVIINENSEDNAAKVTYVTGAKLGTLVHNGKTFSLYTKTSDSDTTNNGNGTKLDTTSATFANDYYNLFNYRKNADYATITFVTNGGTFETGITNDTLTTTDLKLASSTEIKYTGHNLTGWYLDENCTTLFSDSKDLKDKTIGSDITLYANWEIIKLTVTLTYEGVNYSATVDYGYTLSIDDLTDASGNALNVEETTNQPATTPVAYSVGYTWGGWQYKTATVTTATEFTFGSTQITEDTTLQAYWAINTYKITLALNGGTFSKANTATEYTVEYNNTLASIDDTLSKSYSYTVNNTTYSLGNDTYTLVGWYTDSDCTNEFVFGESGTKVTQDYTLYAKWDGNKEIINGVIYTRVAASTATGSYESSCIYVTDNSTSQKSKTTSSTNYTITYVSENSNICGTTTTGYYYVITGYIEDVFVELGYYKDGSWLTLENTVYGSPVLEIAAGALGKGLKSYNGTYTDSTTGKTYYKTLKNVLVPSNIVMIGSRAFLDNKDIESIVFLADNVYFSSESYESYNYYNYLNLGDIKTGYTDEGIINYKGETTNKIEQGKDYNWTSASDKMTNSRNYPFYGCTTQSSTKSTNLTVYFKTGYSTVAKSGDDIENANNNLNDGVFVVARESSSSYTRTNNVLSTATSNTLSSSDLLTVSWLYVDVESLAEKLSETTLACNGVDRGDFDWASAITNAITSYGATYFVDGDNIFIACELGEENDADSLYNHLITSIENAIDEFTAEYGEYIHGYNVTSLETVTGVNGNEISFSITTDDATPYYLVNVNNYIDVNETTTDWNVKNASNVTDNNGNITSVVINYVKDGSTDTSTVTYTGNVEYFEYTNALYATGSVSVAAETKYNYELSTVNGSEATDNAVESVTLTSGAASTLTLKWSQTDAKYINVVSKVEFTINDDNKTTEVSTDGDTLFYSDVANKKGNTLNDCTIATTAKGYYFLGWAYDNSGTLTFTNITISDPADGESAFDNTSTYYAIWGYWAYATDENCTTALSCTVTTEGKDFTETTPTLEGTFFGWYTDKNLTSKASDLSSGNYTYYAKAAASTVVVNYVTYTFTKADSFTYGASSSDSNYKSEYYSYTNTMTVDGGYYTITGHDTAIYSSNFASDSDDWLVLKNTVNNFKVLEIAAGAFATSKSTGSLKNVLVPENIVMIGYRAFLDNKSLTTIVFLADTVFFSSNYNNVTYDSKDTSYDSKNYPFYGCTNASNDDSSGLTVYYKKAYSSNMSNSTTLNGGTFVVNRKGTNDFVYASGTTDWMYIDTTIVSTTDVAESTFELQANLINALEAYASEKGVASYQNGDCYFVAGTYNDISAYIKSYITDAIDKFSAEYGSYINGHEVTISGSSEDFDFTGIDVKDATKYYLTEVSSGIYVSETDTTKLTQNGDPETTTVTTTDGSVTYSVTYVTYTYTDSSNTYTFTVTFDTAEYFTYTVSSESVTNLFVAESSSVTAEDASGI
ncbi:MAG: InlB B-repeat-containing protein [Clostridia bacterium]|nr:InlB B-repeat-containing protein [Clostridia bacterium]